MRIAVLDDYQGAFSKLACYARLKDHEVVVFQDPVQRPADLAARLTDFDAVIPALQRCAFPRAVVELLPSRLKLIAQSGGQTSHIDINACSERNIVVTATRGGTPYPAAELTWALILASVRHIPREVEQLKQGRWQTTVGAGLHGKTLGVYALGNIGSCVAQVGKAFGMKVTCWGRAASRARVRAAGYEMPATREEFFATADVLSLHIRLNDETRGIVTPGDLAHMKPAALLVNTSRAALIENGALVEALQRGRPGYAAVDVYEEEPVLGASHPLLTMPNALCTPHLGAVVQSNLENHYNGAIDSILGFAAGRPVNVLNPQALTKRPA